MNAIKKIPHPEAAAKQPSKDATTDMQLVTTLIAAPGADEALRAAVIGMTVDWLGPGACDIAGADENAVRATIGDRPVDVIAQPIEGRRKRLLVAGSCQPTNKLL